MIIFKRNKLLQSLLAVAVISVALVYQNFSPSTNPGNYAGIYVYIDPAAVNSNLISLYSSALTAGNKVDGAVIIMRWSDLEPNGPTLSTSPFAPGALSWISWAQMAAANGKKISIGVIAGFDSPSWLSPKTYPALTVVSLPDPFGSSPCTVRTMPIPWNDVFIYQYNQMITALASELKSLQVFNSVTNANQSVFDAVQIIKVAGINEESEELQLGSTQEAKACNVDVDSIWQLNGLIPDRILSAWNRIGANMHSVFPSAVLSIDIIGNRGEGFSPINNSGDPYTYTPASGVETDLITLGIIAEGLNQYPGQFAVQWNGLSTNPPESDVVNAGNQTPGSIIAWQANERMGSGGSGCPSGTTFQKCAGTEYSALLQNGINQGNSTTLGGQFLEVWAPNIAQFPAAISYAHDHIFANITRGHQ